MSKLGGAATAIEDVCVELGIIVEVSEVLVGNDVVDEVVISLLSVMLK